MGTYTTNYQLYIPTVGEQGWGTLVNGNFTTIDTTMKGLDTRLTAVENEVNGNLSCTSVTTSGKVTANGGIGTTSLTTSSTITSTGKITANGGIVGNLTGNVTGGTISGTTGTFSSTITASKIKQSGVTTVSTSLPSSSETFATNMNDYTCILPYCGHNYTGSLKIRIVGPSSYSTFIYYITNLSGFRTSTTSSQIYAGGTYTLSFTNVPCLYMTLNDYTVFDSLTLS